MSPKTTPIAALLSVVPYFRARGGSAPVAEAARDLGMSTADLRAVLLQLWMCGLPGYGPGDLIDLEFSTEELDDAETVGVSFSAGMDRPVRLTRSEAIALETSLTVLRDHPDVVDPAAVDALVEALHSASGADPVADGPRPSPGGDAETTLRRAVEDGQALRFVYHSASSDTSRTRIVDPARLVVTGGHTYVVGVDRDTGGWRNFRDDRMEGVQPAGPARPTGPEPERGDPAEGPGHLVDVEIRPGAQWFLDEFPFVDVRLTEDTQGSAGSTEPGGAAALARLPYHDREWMIRFLLGHADVLRPSDPDLRAEIADRARRGISDSMNRRTRSRR